MGFNSEDGYITELQTVLRIAHALRNAAGVSHLLSPTTNSPGTSIVTSSINLPSPRPLSPSLLEAGFNHEMAASISKAYQRRAEELKQRIQESIATACREIARLPAAALLSSPDGLMRKLAFTLTELYLRRLEKWEEEITQRIKRVPKAPVKVSSKDSRTFNQACVPLLEHFFEQNPFPTHADKMFLAEKSNMNYRQIHVWFQNHRNRTKKADKTLKKKSTYERATKPLNNPYERSDSRAPKHSKTSSLDGTTEIEVVQNLMSKDELASSSPPHAFPSPYPPTCHYDPFPCKSGSVRFSEPLWRCVPNGKKPSSLSISINDLVERFSRLNVRDGTRHKGSPKLQSNAATVAITVIPSRAPHPSLIVRKYSQSTNMVQLRPPVRAPVSHSKAFQSLSTTSKPVTLVPLSVQSNKSQHLKKRKIASLPQHFPGRIRNTSRDNASSSTSSPSPCLFSMDSESSSYSFSSASSLSPLSDA